nr:MAG TPA: hypothetical protein [Microviridae sp.]
MFIMGIRANKLKERELEMHICFLRWNICFI